MSINFLLRPIDNVLPTRVRRQDYDRDVLFHWHIPKMSEIRTCGGEKVQIEVDFYTGLVRPNDLRHLSRLFF